MLFVQVFVIVTKKIASEIEHVYQLHHHFAGCHAPELIAATKFKTTKIKLGAFSDFPRKLIPTKITRYTVVIIYYRSNYI